jgi:hypothetical protein
MKLVQARVKLQCLIVHFSIRAPKTRLKPKSTGNQLDTVERTVDERIGHSKVNERRSLFVRVAAG